MGEKLYFTNSRSQKLCSILSGSSDKLVVLCHGKWSNKSSQSNKELSEQLNKNGFSTFRFDFTGHGESEGRAEEITISDGVDDLKSAINFVKEKYNKIYLYGSSFGGIVALGYASKNTDVSALVLKSTVSSLIEKLESEFGKEGINKWRQEGFAEYKVGEKTYKVPYKYYEDSIKYNYHVYDHIEMPVLIVHGNKDEEVPVNQSLELKKHIANSKLEIIKGADHRYTNKQHFAKSIDIIVQWLIKTSNS